MREEYDGYAVCLYKQYLAVTGLTGQSIPVAFFSKRVGAVRFRNEKLGHVPRNQKKIVKMKVVYEWEE